VLELCADAAYRGRGGWGAFCTAGDLCLGIVKGLESSDEEDSTRRSAGREDVGCDTMGEKLPGALVVGVPAICDMVSYFVKCIGVSHNLHTSRSAEMAGLCNECEM